MTHTPAVDSLEQVVADMRAKYFRNSIEHEFADRIAALTRPAGGSERLRELIARWRTDAEFLTSARNKSNWHLHQKGVADAYLLSACADELESALASPQGAEPQVPRGVWEALQRMIEDGFTRGPASAEDALLVAKWRGSFASAQGAEQRQECRCHEGNGARNCSIHTQADFDAQRPEPAATQGDAEPAWQRIATAEVEFLNNLAEKGGLGDPVPGMLRHCARLIVGYDIRDRFKLAARTLIRGERDADGKVKHPVYAEDVETLHDVLRILESLAALSSPPGVQADTWFGPDVSGGWYVKHGDLFFYARPQEMVSTEGFIIPKTAGVQAAPEVPQDGPCAEDDGCPVERAVLQRFWRAHQVQAAQVSDARADGIAPRDRLWDSQWVNIVNHANCYRDMDKEAAVACAVKLTEQAMAAHLAGSAAHGGEDAK